MNNITSDDLNVELDSLLKSKGLYSDRLIALERFHDSKKEDIKHGINIQTELSIVDYSHDTLKEGTCSTNFYKNDFDKNTGVKIFTLPEFMHDPKEYGSYKDRVSAIIRDRSKVDSLNKLDYLHMTLADIKIMIFENSVETFNVERLIEGNNYSHLILIICEGSRLNIYFRSAHPNNYAASSSSLDFSSSSDDTTTNTNNIITDFTDIIVEKKSKVNIIEQRMLSNSDIVFGRKNLELDENSSANWINIDKDSKLALIEQKIILKGNNSSSTMSNILCGKDSQYTIYNISEHLGRNTTSLMQNKCGLRLSKAIVRGLVQIDSTAENSNGYQKSDILLMDNVSRGISMPDLKIHNDKVKCSHGSTITRLDEEKIFYLQSRGLDRNDAEKLLVEGFYEKILADIDDESLRDKIRLEVLS